MQLDPEAFNTLLLDMGQAVSWQRASLCPCRDEHSGAGRPGCPACNGRGVLWAPSVDAWLGLTSMRQAREWAAFGQWQSGDVVVTLPGDSPCYAAGEYDRLVMVNSSEPFSVARTRGDSDTLAFPVVSIERVFWLSLGDAAVVDGGIPTVGTDGALSWEDPATAPDPAMQYSITGRRRPEYFVFKELPQDRAHHGGLALPRRVALRRFDLFSR